MIPELNATPFWVVFLRAFPAPAVGLEEPGSALCTRAPEGAGPDGLARLFIFTTWQSRAVGSEWLALETMVQTMPDTSAPHRAAWCVGTSVPGLRTAFLWASDHSCHVSRWDNGCRRPSSWFLSQLERVLSLRSRSPRSPRGGGAPAARTGLPPWRQWQTWALRSKCSTLKVSVSGWERSWCSSERLGVV